MIERTKKILVTGSRDFTNVEMLRAALIAEVPEGVDQVIVIQGGARGADRIALDLSVASPVATTVTVPADWVNLPRWLAGPRRNAHMLELGPDIVLAFFLNGAKNSGTSNCVMQAKNLDIPVKEFWSD